ncbi:hypothetical protein IQ37_10015 [Chryseobacterium piperi]|uniref:Uncharacterized protein n=1 Tax=Chryseobacterium piperi TaxID=558152 RepID=A0A086BIE0_9FLAO|nr:hypothetical protein [Chryseobacterium piperi]ASW73017.1 hypothetical protein CJF12_01070 [Chryseobacterium piperi]KFF28704.1 hypothetical protein IQ37_10015 [Chryseobacterium piperi]
MICDQELKGGGDQAFDRKKKKNADINDKQAFFHPSFFQHLHKISRGKTTDDDTADDIGIKSNGCPMMQIDHIDDEKYRSIQVNDSLYENRNS